ncbi:MAG: exodeoxyribonuclease V subunit beta, partial [Gammaproteobacteria bacterium]|nr:exodeoxyribonuclease V subunit beta [Gammaproteobacteria bacterium]
SKSDLQPWLTQLDIPAEEIIRRLRTAILDIDRSSIFTIHGLCQRLLSEFPLDGRQQFEQELIADTSAMMQNIMDDLWRREFYQRSQDEVALLRWRYRTPEALYGSLQGIDWRQKIYPEAEGIQPALDVLMATTAKLQKQWLSVRDDLHTRISSMVAEGHFIKAYADGFELSWRELDQFCSGQGSDVPKLSVLQMLSLELLQSPKGLKKNRYEQAEEIHFGLLDSFIEQLEQLQLQLRLSALAWLSSEYEVRMERASLLSFDSLIERMGTLLEGGQSESLKRLIQDKYAVALIDEFQDTDQTQWSIFFKLFGGGQHFLYLIGDPKQAIYKFRGADIFTYFAAQSEAHHLYTLEKNWRSTPHLVDSVNTLFSGHENPFRFEQLQFHPVTAARRIEDGHIIDSDEVVPPMALWQLPQSEQKNGFWSATKADSHIRTAVIAEIVKLLSADATASLVEGASRRAVVPGDIAILVRTHRQASSFQEMLAQVGVPSVQSGSGNIFASAEASELLQLLLAVANPSDQNLLKNLLLLPWCGLNGQEIFSITHNDHQLSEWFEQLHKYHQLWLDSGVMAMVSHFVDELLIRHIAQLTNAERVLTNINHLAELLQHRVDEESLGVHKTVAWLQGEIDAGTAVSEGALSEQQLRLESDDEALKIITMHSSKGLEFPIVFAPYLWQRLSFVEKEQDRISCHEAGELVTDIGSENFEARRAVAIEEELAEELRILYVALTRAKYRCYLTWADVRSSATPNRSALSYLLFSEGGDGWIESLHEKGYESQLERLSTLAKRHPQQFEYRDLTNHLDVERQTTAASEQQRGELAARQFTRSVDRRWQMSSYSALTHLSTSDDLHQLPETPVDKAQEERVTTVVRVAENELPRGAHFGNVLHELLEQIPFTEIAQGNVDRELREQLSQRYGLELADPAQLEQLLQRVVTTPLAHDKSDLTLANISPSSTLVEMPFYLSMEKINTAEINRLLKIDPTVGRLHEIELEGYLTGFIDLIFEHQGQYYLLDYKSNYLEDYSTATLESAMHHHNYGLQYWIYSVVLHRYLKRRLPHYQYRQHFGSVLYLFVRGMQPTLAESGVYRTRPDEEILMALDRALGGEG